MSKIIVTGAYNAFITEPFKSKVLEATMRGVFVTKNGDVGSITLTDESRVPIADVVGWCSAEGHTVTGYPVWIKISNNDLADEVPAYMPNAEIEEGVARTWFEYRDEAHVHFAKDGFTYVAGNSFGEELEGDVISNLVVDAFTLLTKQEFQEVVNAE